MKTHKRLLSRRPPPAAVAASGGAQAAPAAPPAAPEPLVRLQAATVSVKVAPAVHAAVRALASEAGLSTSDAVAALVRLSARLVDGSLAVAIVRESAAAKAEAAVARIEAQS